MWLTISTISIRSRTKASVRSQMQTFCQICLCVQMSAQIAKSMHKYSTIAFTLKLCHKIFVQSFANLLHTRLLLHLIQFFFSLRFVFGGRSPAYLTFLFGWQYWQLSLMFQKCSHVPMQPLVQNPLIAACSYILIVFFVCNHFFVLDIFVLIIFCSEHFLLQLMIII